jgi:lysophospholipase L1-like esterase
MLSPLMPKWAVLLVSCAAMAAGCSSGSLTGPSVDHATVARLSRTRFLAFGDSMTLGEVTVPVGRIIAEPDTGFAPATRQVLVPTVAYPLLLHGHLTARYATQASSIVVTGSGRAGEHPHEGVQRFNNVFAAERPEVVLLFEGANSLWLYGSDLPTLGLGNMVDTALAGGAQVFVATMPPTRPGLLNSVPMVELLAFNRKVAEMAAIKGTRLVNLYDPMLPDVVTLIGSDGLHPTEAGYRRIAELFFQAIQTHLEVR